MASAPPVVEAPAAPVVETPASPTAIPDNAPSFEDAFAAAAAAENANDTTTISPPNPAPVVEAPVAPTPGAEPPAGTPPVVAPPAASAAAPEAPPAPAAPAALAAPAAPTAEEIVRGLTERLAQPAVAPVAPAAPAAEQAPIYTADEQTILADYAKNWPDVAQAEALTRKGEYHDLLKYTFTEVHKFLAPHLAQIAAMGNTLHEGELKTLVTDYTPAMETDVSKWIDTQPSYLQGPYKQVMQQGTSEEVADLIGRYRATTGTAPAPAAPAPAVPAVPAPAPAAPAKTELSNLAKQAAESLAPVSSDRTQVLASEDPQDFLSAFARYASEAAVP